MPIEDNLGLTYACVYAPTSLKFIGLAFYDVELQTIFVAEFICTDDACKTLALIRPTKVVTNGRHNSWLTPGGIDELHLEYSRPIDFQSESTLQKLLTVSSQNLSTFSSSFIHRFFSSAFNR
jgi:DNA mismatch repair ATPase MutS